LIECNVIKVALVNSIYNAVKMIRQRTESGLVAFTCTSEIIFRFGEMSCSNVHELYIRS